MDNVKEIIFVTLISALIGLFVGTVFQYLNTSQLSSGMIPGAISGAIIGIISNYCFMLVHIKLRRHPVIAFATVIATIALGTYAFCLFWKVSFPVPGIPIIVVSEILGIIATAIVFRNYVRLNNSLQGKIRELRGRVTQIDQ